MAAGDDGIDLQDWDEKLCADNEAMRLRQEAYLEDQKHGDGRNLVGQHRSWEEYKGHYEDLRLEQSWADIPDPPDPYGYHW